MDYVTHPWINPNTIERRTYQETIVATAVTGNTLAVLPTGMGKTNIAAMVAAYRLGKDMKKKILFLAPTRPLVEQHKKSFEKFLKTVKEDFQVITGENSPSDRIQLYSKASIIFSTPQTIHNDLQNNVLTLKDFCLLIFDEAHRAVGNYAYPYVARAYMHQSGDPLILALTASPGSYRGKIDEVKSKLFIKNVEIRTREDEDVKPYVQDVSQSFEEVELTNELKAVKEYLEKIKQDRIKKLVSWGILHSYNITKSQILQLQESLAKKKTGIGYAAMSQLAEVLKVDHALLLLETQCVYSLEKYLDSLITQETKAVARLLKDENFKNAIRLVTELSKEGREHPKIQKLKDIISSEIAGNEGASIIVFAQYRDTISRICEQLKTLPKVSPVEFVGQAKKSGRGLSQKEQVQILGEFSMGFYNVLVASSVAEEGLDISETTMVVFYEPIPSAVRKIQRSGRTARTMPGKVVTLMTKGTRDEAYYWVGHHKEKKMTSILRSMNQKNLAGFAKAEKPNGQ